MIPTAGGRIPPAVRSRPAGPGCVWLNWHGYRYFRGKAQKISVSVMGAREDLDELAKALRSLKLSEE